MKIVLTGSLGNIGKPLATKLVQTGHSVTVISSNAGRTPEIEALGAKAAIGKPDLKWEVITDEELLNRWLGIGFNEQVAKGFVELQASQRTGLLYEDYYSHKPALGKVKLADFAKQFAEVYNEARE